MKVNKHKHKNHDRFIKDKDVVKSQKLERIATDLIKNQDYFLKLKEKEIKLDIFKLFENDKEE